MINVSSEYREVLSGNDRVFYAYAEITLKDGTVLSLDNSNILDIKIDDASTPNNNFTIGSAIINQLTLQINNLYDEFSDYDFTDAIIRPSVGLQLSETIETVHKGVFIADDPKAAGSVINITALDYMSKFDRPFSEVTQSFPCSARDLLITVCTHCGVSLATSTFYNQDYIIETRPDDDAISCREIISWIAQISVTFAKINNQGSLVLKWYDEIDETEYNGGIFDEDTPYSSGDNVDGGTFAFNDGDNIDGGSFTNLKKFHHIYSLYNKLDLAIDDVVITGVSVSDPVTIENSVLYGETGYVISLEGNKLIQSELDAQFIAQSIGQKIIGMRFRPFETTTRSDPTKETGDAIKVSDRKGNVYHSIVTNYTYSIAKPCRISCEAESPSRNSSKRYSESTKAVVEARKNMEKKLTAYDLAVQQMTSLIVHAFGLYKTEETLPDGSKIFYSHDKPTRAESSFVYQENSNGFFVSNDGGQTWNSGWDADGNAVFNVLSAIGINAEWIKVLTSFSVGDNFSVNEEGKLVAKNADIQGHIEADSGEIAGMEIGADGFEKVYTINGNNFTVSLSMLPYGFILSTENTDNTMAGGINVIHDASGVPNMNIYVRDASGTRDDKVYLNGQPILQNYTSLNDRLTHLVNWAITTFNYNPLS